MVIGPEGIKMEEKKVKGVLDWPTPKCVKDVQKFLGLAKYYCQFVEGFASIFYTIWLGRIKSGTGQKNKKRHLES